MYSIKSNCIEMESGMTNSTTIAQDWDAVADAWDEHADHIDDRKEAATAALIDRVSVQPGDRVLELAAGPGTLGATWAALVGTTGSALLTDVAPAMVDVARRRNAALNNVSVAVIDASSIDHPDQSFDIVAARMGLMFTLDPGAALAEIHRVLVPGGRFGALTWGALEHNPWLTCIGMAAMLNGLGSGPPVGPGGIFSLGDPVHLEALVRNAGFDEVRIDEFTITFRAQTIDEHLARASSLAGPLAVILRDASDEQRAAVRRTATELAAPFLTDDGLSIPGRALLVSARRD